MSDTNPASSAAEVDSSASTSNETNNTQNDAGKQVKTVKPDDHTRLLDDFKKQKGANIDLKKRISDLESLVEQTKVASLKEKEDWKTLYETTKAQNEELVTKDTQRSQAFSHTQKYNAVLAEALKAGLQTGAEEILESMALNGVDLEVTNTGRYNVLGAADFVNDLKTRKPFMFESNKAPNVNSRAGGANPGTPMTWDKLNELEKKDPARYKLEAAKLVQQLRAKQ